MDKQAAIHADHLTSVTADAFVDELEKLGVRIGKIMPKIPVGRAMRKGMAKTLKWLRGKGATGKALARVAQDPELAALLVAAPIYIGGQLVPFPLFGTATGTAALLALQAPRIGRLRRTYRSRMAKR